jgi:hypothetical protein
LPANENAVDREPAVDEACRVDRGERGHHIVEDRHRVDERNGAFLEQCVEADFALHRFVLTRNRESLKLSRARS